MRLAGNAVRSRIVGDLVIGQRGRRLVLRGERVGEECQFGAGSEGRPVRALARDVLPIIQGSDFDHDRFHSSGNVCKAARREQKKGERPRPDMKVSRLRRLYAHQRAAPATNALGAAVHTAKAAAYPLCRRRQPRAASPARYPRLRAADTLAREDDASPERRTLRAVRAPQRRPHPEAGRFTRVPSRTELKRLGLAARRPIGDSRRH